MKKIILLQILVFSLNAFAQMPTSGLIAYYPFNSNANDASGNGHNGVVNGATLTTDRFGNSNSAYNFNGLNNLIDIGNINPSQFTLSAWVKLSSIKDYNTILMKQVNAGPIKNFELRLDSGVVEYNFGTGSAWVEFSDSNHFKINTWYHIVNTYNGAQYKLYLNGNLIGSHNASGYQSDNSNVYIGSRNVFSSGSLNYVFNGSIDDVRIYGRALDNSEIQLLNNESLCYKNITVTDTLLIKTSIIGFNPITYQNTIKVWPNPAKDHITIDNGNIANMAGYQLKITNSLGQQMFQSAINKQQFFVSISSWTGNGIYFLYIIDGKGNTIDIKKIVID